MIMDYIRFSVDGQRLYYNQKCYFSTDTVDMLYCNFEFETDDLGHIRGEWDLPYHWAQFHDENGNVYVNQVVDNTCSIPYDCLRQSEFKMTLFATDTEDYMVCTKRYTTNEIAFRFSGSANLNYDGGVSPDEPFPKNWKILLDRVDTCENTVTKLDKVLKGTGAGFHSSIYRGAYLGDTYTDAQKEAIANGSFDDLFVGDYWTINGVNWRIADFDYYYNIGDTSFNKHHVVIVPDTTLYNAQMNSTNITTGCYTGSEMYTTNLDNARTAFDNAFGSSFIPTHRGLYSNAVGGSTPSGWAWRDMRVELMNEEQVYGHAVWGACNQNGYDVGTQKTQFKLFALDQTKINIRQDYWLTNVRSSAGFAGVSSSGYASYDSASVSLGVRPFACLVGA